MSKKLFTLFFIVFTLVILFVWGGNFTPHNAVEEVYEATIKYDSESISNSKEDIPTEEIFQEKPQLKKSIEEKDNTPVSEIENLTCTLIVKCDTILNNSDKLNKQKADIIPEDGIIYYSNNVHFFEGESVFNVLSREMKQNKIHFDFEITPAFDTAYIKGIANIYEFDCGELSGWLYRVNGQTSNVGCSLYSVSVGDKIEIVYTCEMGKDLE